MKIRNGFVSNSSSSSFICDITGEVESGYDMSYEDAGFACCKNGHKFLESFKIPSDTVSHKHKLEYVVRANLKKDAYNAIDRGIPYVERKELKKAWEDEHTDEYMKKFDTDEIDDLYEATVEQSELPSEMCPICQMVKIRRDDRYHYLLKLVGKSESEIDEDMKNRFNSYSELLEFLK